MLAYLQKPNVRHRPNSRFLAATVLGVQQANRVVEVDEMWRARKKELELESKTKSRINGRMQLRSEERKDDSRDELCASKIEQDRSYAMSSSSRDSDGSSYVDREDGLGDNEIEEFLRSRVKRGRGAIGSRMDEPGPYLTTPPSGRRDNSSSLDVPVEEWKRRVHGPEKPLFFRSKSSDEFQSTSKHQRGEKRKNDSNREREEKEKSRSKHHHHQHKKRRE